MHIFLPSQKKHFSINTQNLKEKNKIPTKTEKTKE